VLWPNPFSQALVPFRVVGNWLVFERNGPESMALRAVVCSGIRLRLAFPRLNQLVKQMGRRPHAVVEVVQVQLLVGGVGVLVGQTPHG